MFRGVYTALITPFKDGSIDYDSLDRIIEEQVTAGVSGVLPMGTTGESPTVSHEEHNQIIAHVVKAVNGRVKVLAGTGSNSTDEAVFLSKNAEKCGADAVLVVNPYYNKPPQRCLVDHFATVAKNIGVPVMLYNIPGRTGVNFEPESMAELCEVSSNVVALKEAAGDIGQVMRIVELLGNRLNLMIGDDNLVLPAMAVGATGVVSVLSNIIPADMVKVASSWLNGEHAESKELFYRILPLCRMMFLDTNPIPIKAVMAAAGKCSPQVRKPLLPLEDDKLKIIVQTFAEYGVKL
ncbi:MAG: 4-hydroxy-tetrahydrodipicolinate synthase [Spirochaetes bacterium]|nr:4-hydroxy-tetrahydrodipicolinate synthase [Spirochaetota bacterium]MBN2771639.1 4-hydroxy-tetrahydrodipicolinate synthase [Spirochaetota bacterium]